jgi:hypothetical protein
MTPIPRGSTAVMARRFEPHDSLDFFPTPLWATRALVEHVQPAIRGRSVWDPACGDGAMHRALAEYASVAVASDVHDYGWGHMVRDFLWPDPPVEAEWIITNPPFRLAEQFAFCALSYARFGAALLVRTSFIEGVGRFERLFDVRPPTVVAQFAERVPMVKGRLDADVSTATAYCWLVWDALRPDRRTTLEWIPPCRARLTRPNDYDNRSLSVSRETSDTPENPRIPLPGCETQAETCDVPKGLG